MKMKCRDCPFWSYEEDQANDNAGICECLQSSMSGCWTYPMSCCEINDKLLKKYKKKHK